jgi:hypothetical membrane protein
MNHNLFYLALAGPAIFILTALVFGLVKPNYRPVRNTISELALGRYGYVQTINFVVSGLLLASLGVTIALQNGSSYGSTAVTIMGAVLFLSAIFPTDPTTANGSTTVGKIHNAIFLVGMLAIISAQFVVGFSNLGSALGIFSLVCGVLAPVNLVAMVTQHAYAGLFQRLLVLTIMVWISGFGLSALGW